MSDLIDRQVLIDNKFKNDISYNAFVNLVKRQPIVETITRCRSCSHGTVLTTDQRVWCDLHETVWNPDGFCSGGEPK